jgi:hypothetical protein
VRVRDTGEGKKLRLRGIYGWVMQDEWVSVWEVVKKEVALALASHKEVDFR